MIKCEKTSHGNRQTTIYYVNSCPYLFDDKSALKVIKAFHEYYSQYSSQCNYTVPTTVLYAK